MLMLQRVQLDAASAPAQGVQPANMDTARTAPAASVSNFMSRTVRGDLCATILQFLCNAFAVSVHKFPRLFSTTLTLVDLMVEDKMKLLGLHVVWRHSDVVVVGGGGEGGGAAAAAA